MSARCRLTKFFAASFEASTELQLPNMLIAVTMFPLSGELQSMRQYPKKPGFCFNNGIKSCSTRRRTSSTDRTPRYFLTLMKMAVFHSSVVRSTSSATTRPHTLAETLGAVTEGE